MADIPIIPPSLTALGSGAAALNPAAPAAAGESFLASLKDAIAKVNEAQVQADGSVQAMLTGTNTNLHETMIALEKAEVSFQLMVQVRNKIVGAYEEIMRMQL